MPGWWGLQQNHLNPCPQTPLSKMLKFFVLVLTWLSLRVAIDGDPAQLAQDNIFIHHLFRGNMVYILFSLKTLLSKTKSSTSGRDLLQI